MKVCCYEFHSTQYSTRPEYSASVVLHGRELIFIARKNMGNDTGERKKNNEKKQKKKIREKKEKS